MQAARPTSPTAPDRRTDPALRELSQQVAELTRQLKLLVERQRARDELFEEMQPVLAAVMKTATDKLQTVEEKGYFTFAREALRVADRIVESYGEEDVRLLGDNIVRIMDTVRAMTQPQVLAIAGDAAEVFDRAGELEPTGIFGMVRASRDEDVQRGMAVFLEVLRHVGRGVKEVAQQGPAERRALPAPRAAAPAAKAPVKKPPAKEKPPPPREAPVQIDGVAFDAAGFMVDASQWTPELASAMAAAQGIAELSERHWQALTAARNDFLETGQSPNIRRLSAISGLGVKDLYALFPKAPGMTVARLAGCPKPVGCI